MPSWGGYNGSEARGAIGVGGGTFEGRTGRAGVAWLLIALSKAAGGLIPEKISSWNRRGSVIDCGCSSC